jgi:hypothetical protein
MTNSTRMNSREEEVRDEYFENLCELVGIGGPTHRSFLFAKTLFEKEFYWSVPNDDNRAEDGKELRKLYCGREYTSFVARALEGPCSVLEMLIALAERIEDMLATQRGPNRTKKWFWEMIHNLGLREIFDDDSPELIYTKRRDNQRALDIFLRREYLPNGKGGLFPHTSLGTDARKVEIWYQMQSYYAEKYL